MDNRQLLINQLADGAYHSGEALGAQLNVSRTAIWKQLKKLAELGIELESCKRRGYRIPGGLSLLDESLIRDALTAGALAELLSLELHQQIDSTNELAMECARQGSASGLVLLAESQTAGKGRRGRTWVSPFGRNIYVSAVRSFSGGVAAVEGLSLAVGVAVVQSLEAMGASGLGLKWPNDILWSGRKLGGILLEITGDPAGACEVIVGIGINAQMSAAQAQAVEQAWVNLAEITGAAVDRNQLVASLLNTLLPLLANFEADGFTRYQQAWQDLDTCYGEPVELIAGDSKISGIARGVDSAGSICIETSRGVQSFSGGEISLRRRP